MRVITKLALLYGHCHPPIALSGKRTDPLLTPQASRASYWARTAALATAALLLPILRVHVGKGTPDYQGAFWGCCQTGDSCPQSTQRMPGLCLVHRAVSHTLLKTGEKGGEKNVLLLCVVGDFYTRMNKTKRITRDGHYLTGDLTMNICEGYAPPWHDRGSRVSAGMLWLWKKSHN